MTSLPVVRQVEVDGLRLAYRRTGTGPPLVLLHSGLSDSRDWTGQLASLVRLVRPGRLGRSGVRRLRRPAARLDSLGLR